MSSVSNAPTLRRRVCALALPGFPLALLAGTLVSPTDSTSNGPQLLAAAAHGARWNAAAACELLGAVVFPFAIAGVVHAVRGRGARLANVAGVLGALGTVGMASIALRHFFIYGLATTERATALHALDRIDSSVAGPLAFLCMLAGPVALIVLAGAAARAGLAPRWTVAGAVAFFVSDMLPIPGAELVQAAIGLATLGTIALRLLRLAEETREAPTRSTEQEAARLEPSPSNA